MPDLAKRHQSDLTENELIEIVKWVASLPVITASISEMPNFNFENFIKNIDDLRMLYFLIGKSLDRYYKHQESPYFEQEKIFPKYITETIKSGVSRYAAWNLLFFEAEHYVRQEASKYGFEYTSRLNALKRISQEESEFFIQFLSQSHSETLTGRQLYDLQQSFTHNKPLNFTPKDRSIQHYKFTSFCAEIFWKHRSDCPSYKGWAIAMGFEPNRKVQMVKKITVIDGKVQKPETRKKKPKESLRDSLGLNS